jgi:hypothetical protein
MTVAVVTPYALSPQEGRSIAASNLVKKVALTCLKELAISLVLATLVAFFIPVQAGLNVLMVAVGVQLAVSLVFHSLGAYASYKLSQKGSNKTVFGWLESIAEAITGANFALLTGFNTQTLIHESGHALATLAVYRNPRPQIEIYPFIGGHTEFYKTPLTPFGKKIGPAAATCLVVASGPGLTLLISAILLIVGLAIKEKYPQISRYLIVCALFDFIGHAYYAYSALYTRKTNLRHDFVHLSIFGLNPVTAAVGILAIPAIIALGMYCLCGKKKAAC